MPKQFVFNDFDGQVDLPTRALEKLQQNILRSSGNPRATQIFRRFESRRELFDWLLGAPPASPSTESGAVSVSLLFTLEGLKLLGLTGSHLAGMDPAFRRGSRDPHTLRTLGDAGVTSWREHEAPWHAVEIYTHGVDTLIPKPSAGSFVVEHGTGIRLDGSETSAGEPSFGHFKIRDGVSQQVYTQADYDQLVRGLARAPAKGQAWKWDPRRKLSTLIVRDPLASSADLFGSYFVFRKYKQDVALFERRIDAIARDIEERRKHNDPEGILSPELRKIAIFNGQTGEKLREAIKECVFGRRTDGSTAFGTDENDFNFDDDVDGRTCPFHSHMRKMAPRGRTGDVEFERGKSIARRGMSYKVTDLPGGVARQETGLLFWCAQASIQDQFEFVQERWANSARVDLDRQPTPDVDTVIGVDPVRQFGNSQWVRWTKTSDVNFGIWDSVVVVGSEYFYAPSLEGVEALKQLARHGKGATP